MSDFDLDSLLEGVEEESEFDKIFKMMLNPENIHHVTDLTDNEIRAFSAITSLANYHQINFLKEWLADSLKFRVSRNRKGRAEVVKITSRAQMNPMDENQRKRWFSRQE